jgi:hypothetical protein
MQRKRRGTGGSSTRRALERVQQRSRVPGSRHAGKAPHRAAPVVRQLTPQLGYCAERGARQLAALPFTQ